MEAVTSRGYAEPMPPRSIDDVRSVNHDITDPAEQLDKMANWTFPALQQADGPHRTLVNRTADQNT
ncbi:hypothetical protein AU198_10735 [Mycobacterium sp. GA-1199]|nr:hypothetical protein AU198_10735 [Mycobacterium sp. GA-1199]